MNPKGALKGMRVLDTSNFIAGPLAAKILGDLGADVIKLENRKTGGDASRVSGSPFIDGVASFVQTLNAGKKCVTVNTKDPRGLELFFELIKTMDVYIDNRPVGHSEKMGLGWEKLHEINPRLIYCRITGFGMTETKYRDWGSYDPVFEGMSGFMAVTGEPGTPPGKAGVAIGDMSGALWSTIAILAAYEYQQKTGKGQLIDFALLDGMLGLMENNVATYTFSKKAPGKIGNAHPNIGPFNTFKTSDAWVFIAIGTNELANDLADIIGHPELKDDPRYATNNIRVANRDWIEKLITEWTFSHTTAEVIEALSAKAIPVGPIYNMEDVYNDPYFRLRKMIVEVEHPQIGKIEIPGSPLSFLSETPAVVDKACGLLGAENEEVFEGLGLSPELYEQYVKEGVI